MTESAARVLLVDDDPQVLVALEDILSEDYSVLTAPSAQQALRLAHEELDIAVILTDQRMPGMTGDELLRSLGPSHPAQRILVTGYADLHSVIRAVNDGKVFAYITKPWEEGDLRSKVNTAVDHYRLTLQLSHERQLLRDLMDNTPDGIAFRGADRRFQRVNHPFAQMVGAESTADLIGKTLDEFAGEFREFRSEDEQVLDGGQPLYSVRSYGSGTRARWISETVAPIRDGRRKSVGLVTIARDVTQHREMEAALRKSEKKFREQSGLLNSIMDGMDYGVVLADSGGVLQFFNRRAEELLGESLQGQTLQSWRQKLCPRDEEEPITPEEDPLLRAIHAEPGATTEAALRVRGDQRRLVSVIASRVDSVDGAVALVRDVTLQTQLQHQLQQSQKLEALGQLAGGIAHDFGNFIGVIQSYAYLIRHALGQDHVAQVDIDEILTATKRAARLTRQLLVFGRHRVVTPQPTDLNTIVIELESMLSRVIGAHIELRTELAPGLPPVRIDESQAEQLVMNLALNARDAMPDGGVLTISTSLESSGHPEPRVVLTISDNGHGMSSEVLEHLFEPFFTTKAPGHGTGLGLATVHGVVRQSGGEISVNSRLGEGSQFRLSLPLATDDAVASGLPLLGSRSERPRLPSILLVEDDPSLRTATERLLRRHGYSVLVAQSAEHALALCEAREPKIDIVLTDVMMPEMDGPTLAKRLLAMQSDLRILYMSGYVGAGQLADAAVVQGNVVEKPFDPADLMSKLESALGA